MTSPKLRRRGRPNKTDWPVVGSRVHPDVFKAIDIAASLCGMKRADYIEDTLVRRAFDDCAAHGLRLDRPQAA